MQSLFRLRDTPRVKIHQHFHGKKSIFILPCAKTLSPTYHFILLIQSLDLEGKKTPKMKQFVEILPEKWPAILNLVVECCVSSIKFQLSFS